MRFAHVFVVASSTAALIAGCATPPSKDAGAVAIVAHAVGVTVLDIASRSNCAQAGSAQAQQDCDRRRQQAKEDLGNPYAPPREKPFEDFESYRAVREKAANGD